MIQKFEIFKGAPDDLVIRLITLRTAAAEILQVMLTGANAQYLIIYKQ